MGSALSSFKRDRLWKHLQPQVPRRITMLGGDDCGKSSILARITSESPYKVTLDIAIEKPVWEWLKLPKLTIGVFDIQVCRPRYVESVQEFVRENIDGIIFAISANPAGRCAWESILWELSEYVFAVEETKHSVLLVLITRLDEERSAPFEEIRQDIDKLIAEKGRAEQCYAIKPANGKTGEGLEEAFDWFSDKLNHQPMRAV
ncbi:hypothetical protein BDZ85DRAFT_300438 [Elsinoe ampelina]|uniref:P-loop containing nucleoside triphosphate hydrolase protein n=1 Tax=Elsinoe ampelina TaxID=302913 RepID=A0A6A6GPG3_9PEZI|nr:hypothetical protein BDZ85DRAFT_300438 [Elsinoe ampelina]